MDPAAGLGKRAPFQGFISGAQDSQSTECYGANCKAGALEASDLGGFS